MESANFSMNLKLVAESLCVLSLYIIRSHKTEKAFEISVKIGEKSMHRQFFNLEWSAFCYDFALMSAEKTFLVKFLATIKESKRLIRCFRVFSSVLSE